MKKFIAMILAVVTILGCTVAFSSCTVRPDFDIDDAEDALKDEDYIVYVDDDAGTAGIKQTLTATNGKDTVSIIWFEDFFMAKLYYQELKLQREYEIKETELKIKTIKKMLKKYDDDLKSTEVDYYEDELKDLQKELKELKKDYVIGRSGKKVWSGTKAAVKDTK